MSNVPTVYRVPSCDEFSAQDLRACDVVRDDTMKVPVIERQTYMCSACRHIARRLVFSRAKMPVTHLPVITTPPINLQKGRVAPPSGTSLIPKVFAGAGVRLAWSCHKLPGANATDVLADEVSQ